MRTVKPLTYGVVRKNSDVLNALQGVQGFDDAVPASIALLKLADPPFTDEELDDMTPGGIVATAGDLYRATFARPEETAPAPTNP